jgi:membrane fusion protein (multidrug efflux system)
LNSKDLGNLPLENLIVLHHLEAMLDWSSSQTKLKKSGMFVVQNQSIARGIVRIASGIVLSLLISLSLWAESAQGSTQKGNLSFDTVLIVENDVEIKTRLTGIIEEILVDRGSRVNKGDPLAKLQNDDLALEVQKAKVQMQEQDSQYQRAKSLYDQKLLSASEYDGKRLSYEQAVAEYDLSKVNFEKSIIKAPFRGIVVERFVKTGQRVVEDENVALFRITAMEPLLARLFIPEEQVLGIGVGLKADFIPTFDSGKKYPARVKWISAAIDPASGTVSVLVELLPGENRGNLKPGTSGKIVLNLGNSGKTSSH